MLIRGVKVLVLVLRGADFTLPSIFQHFVAIQIFQVCKKWAFLPKIPLI